MGIWVDWYLLALLFRAHTVNNKPVYDVFSLGLSTVFRFTGLETGGVWRSRGKAALLHGLWISSGCSLTLLVSSHPCVLGPPCLSVHSSCPLVKHSFVVSVVASVRIAHRPVPPALTAAPYIWASAVSSSDWSPWVLSVSTDYEPGALHALPHFFSWYPREVASLTVPIKGMMWRWGSWGSQRFTYLTKAVPWKQWFDRHVAPGRAASGAVLGDSKLYLSATMLGWFFKVVWSGRLATS